MAISKPRMLTLAEKLKKLPVVAQPVPPKQTLQERAQAKLYPK